MKISSPLPVWAVCLGCCLFASASGRAAPEPDETAANLDTAVYDSSEVVEGRVVGWPLPDNKAVAEVELTAVHKGDLKSGQIISVFSFLAFNNFYVVDGSDASGLLPQVKVEPLSSEIDRVIISGPGRLLEKGERLALFLNLWEEPDHLASMALDLHP